MFVHNEYDFFGPKIGFDIFRFEDGRIVEHWDNLQETPQQPNPSGHTMIDGPTKPTDVEKTDANKQLVRNFVEDVFAEYGVKVLFDQVAMKPGKPTVFGHRGDTFVFGLPGNPVSNKSDSPVGETNNVDAPPSTSIQ